MSLEMITDSSLYLSVQENLESLRHGKTAMIITAASVVAFAAAPALALVSKAALIVCSGYLIGSTLLLGAQLWTDYAPDLCKMLYGFIKGQPEILPNGSWVGLHVLNAHFFDKRLCKALIEFFKGEKAQSVVDFGCGDGKYVQKMIAEGISTYGYDGNPSTPTLSNGTCQTLDLSKPVQLAPAEWVMSLEVGEHLPKEFEQTFIANLMRTAEKGIVLSWAKKGQGGHGHVNEQNNDYIKAIFAENGWVNDVEAEQALRDASYPIYFWFYDTVMVFRKA